MNMHVYDKDTQVVLMGYVRVADWRTELRHFELSRTVADVLLLKMSAEENELGLRGSELLDLLQRKGEIADVVKLSGAKEKVARTLAALTKLAWEYDVQYSVDETEYAEGDEYFDSFSAAYTVSSEAEMQVTGNDDGEVDG